MAKYTTSGDYADEFLAVTEHQMSEADAFVDAALRKKGIDPSEVALPNPDLRQLAMYYALYLASVENAAGESPEMNYKAEHYRRLYQEKEAQITRAVLGIEGSVGTGWGSIELGRG